MTFFRNTFLSGQDEATTTEQFANFLAELYCRSNVPVGRMDFRSTLLSSAFDFIFLLGGMCERSNAAEFRKGERSCRSSGDFSNSTVA